MENLTTQGAGHDEFDTLFRSATETMCNQLNGTARKLEELRMDHIDKFHEDIDDVNSILVRIRDLNVAIRRNQVYGGNSLEQMDARNNLIDELSKYIRVNVSYEQEDLGANYSVEKLVITTSDQPERTLVDGIYSTRLSIRKNDEGEESENFDLNLGILKDEYGRALEQTDVSSVGSYATQEEAEEALAGMESGPTTDPDGRKVENSYAVVEQDGAYVVQKTSTFKGAVELNDTELYGGLQAEREFLTEKGVFATDEDKAHDQDATVKRGIQFYQKALDVFANKFAVIVNTCNTEAGGQILLSASNVIDENMGINASNITIAKDWLNHARRVIIDEDQENQSTANNALRHMLVELTKEHSYTVDAEQGPDSAATTEKTFFIGTFQEMFTTHIAGTLANDQRATNTMLDNYNALSDEIYVDRDGVHGVDLNDEVMNMTQYQKAYQAACRLMTTFDSLLDKLINGTAI
jgi:flagellar hook-associated protein 1 FlgK